MQRKRSEVVRLALEQFLETDLDVRPIERVRDLLGKVESGLPDLGSQHRDYLKARCVMAAELLLDTGAFVALIDRSERQHAACVAVLAEWTGPIVTTEAVLTETLYLLGPSWRAQQTCLEFFFRVLSCLSLRH